MATTAGNFATGTPTEVEETPPVSKKPRDFGSRSDADTTLLTKRGEREAALGEAVGHRTEPSNGLTPRDGDPP